MARKRAEKRPKYNRKLWILCTCTECGHKNYVEPHGTTAACTKCKKTTEHKAED
jgi:ribosomal protein L44E